MPRTTASASSSRLNDGRSGFALVTVEPALGAPFAVVVAFCLAGCLATCLGAGALGAGVPVWATACSGSNGNEATRNAHRVRPATVMLPAVLKDARMV